MVEEWKEYAAWQEKYLDDVAEIRQKKSRKRCECDVEFGQCPGVNVCQFADNQGENE